HHAAGRVLAGSSFALLPRPRASFRPASATVSHVLVTTGAVDERGAGAAIAAGLIESVPGAQVRLVVGPWGSERVPPGVHPVRARDGLDDELNTADLVVTAGGVTMLEAMRACRPVVAVVLAENQRRAVEGAVVAGAVVAADFADAARVAGELAADARARAELAATAGREVDGRGAGRVACEWLALL